MWRWLFALKEGWKHRRALKSFLNNPARAIPSLHAITPKKLDEAGVAILILDFDGVLAPHGACDLDQETLSWLQGLALVIGEQRLAILTNNPLPKRLAFLKQHFPLIHVVQQVRKKPYPDGILEVVSYRGVERHQVLLVDDRLLTGLLASCLAYSRAWYFYPPKQNYWRHPLKELGFSLLRQGERGLLRWFA